MKEMTILTSRRAPIVSAWRIAVSSVAVVLLVAACQKDDPAQLFPHPDQRSEAYVMLASGSRLGLVASLLEVVEVTASTTFGNTTVTGLDAIVKNWRRVLEGAKVDMVSRRIIATNDLGYLERRDSGTVTFRLKTPGGGFRDTTMIFMTTWAYKDKRWRIRDDSILGR